VTLLLSLLFLLSRVLHLLFCFFPRLFPDELLIGTIAKELMEGPKISFFDYVESHDMGGSFIYALCTVPFFHLFGKSVFSLRITSLLFQCSSFITWYFFMRKFFGKRAAFYTASLYLLPPAWFTLYAMYALGAHADSLFFTILGLFFLYRILYENLFPKKYAICLGLVCGFGTYYIYTTFVSVVGFFLFWFSQDRRLFQKKELYLFFLFFLIGFSPWFFYNIPYHFQGIEFITRAFVTSPQGQIFSIPHRFLKFVTLKILGMFSFNYKKGNQYHPHITLLNCIYGVVLLFSYGLLYRFERKNPKSHFFFLFPLFYLSVASFSRLEVNTFVNRYFIPLYPFFFATLGLGLHHLGTFSRNLKRLSIGLLLLLMAMGLIGELNLLSPKDAFLALKYQGYSYNELGWAISYRYPDNPKRILELGKKVAVALPFPEQLAFYHGLSNFEFHIQEPRDFQHYLPWIKEFDNAFQPFFLREMGRILGLSEGNFSERIGAITKLLDKEDQPYLIEGLVTSLYPPFSHMKPDPMLRYALGHLKGLSLKNRGTLVYALGKLSWGSSYAASFLEKIERRKELEPQFPENLLSFYYQGVGALLTESYDPLFREWSFSLTQGLKGLNPRYQEFIFWGAGFEAPLHYEDPYEYERMKASIPLKFQHSFEQGLKDRFAWGGRNLWIEGTEELLRSP